MCFDDVTGSVVGWMCPTDRQGQNLSTLSSDRERLCSMCQPSFPSQREMSSRYQALIVDLNCYTEGTMDFSVKLGKNINIKLVRYG